jgi:glycine oxidase
MGKEILIVGAGLSGISVAVHLLKKGHQVTIIDSGENFSSVIAAGQINPMVFRRMTKSWRLDDFLPYAEEFYRQLSIETNTTFYFPIPIRRMFSSAHEKTMWLEKQSLEKFSSYLTPISEEDDDYDLAVNDFGSGRITGSAFVSAVPFIEAAKKWISERGIFLTEAANYTDFNPENSTYKSKKYDEIIFCEGSQNYLNPWFGYLPVEHTKGEVLTIKAKGIDEKESLNRKCFLLPIGNNIFRLGATYSWHTNNLIPTEEGKSELLEKVKLLTKENITILEHKVGIRPTSPDRRPIVGRHHTYKSLSIFNGLGTKGYLIAPKLAQEFSLFLDQESELDKEVKLERFNKLL